jgi:hypothetical protein
MGNQNARWNEASDVIPMFPTLVWKIELEAQLREAIGDRVLAALAHLRRDLPRLRRAKGGSRSSHCMSLMTSGISLPACTASCREFCNFSESVTTRTKSPPAGRQS